MENLPVIIVEVSVAPSGESFRNTFFFCACFRRFTIGSIKTRQITLWAVGLITTNHDMRPIRLSTINFCDKYTIIICLTVGSSCRCNIILVFMIEIYVDLLETYEDHFTLCNHLCTATILIWLIIVIL